MWFKNLQIFRLPAPWEIDLATLEESLSRLAFAQCASSDMESSGWTAPRDGGPLVHAIQGQLLLSFCEEKKLLPASVIRQVLKDRCDQIEERDGKAPGRNEKKELKELVTAELLPRAFSIRRNTLVWIDPVNGWLVIDTSSQAKGEDILTMLIKSIDGLPITKLRVAVPPVTSMTAWLVENEAPAGFTVDQDTVLSARGDNKASVRFVSHDLEADEVRRHVDAGKECTQLALTWNSRISFVLTRTLLIKRVKPIAIEANEDSGDTGFSGDEAADAEAKFNADVLLMTGELNQLLGDLVNALGGYAVAAATTLKESGQDAGPAPLAKAA